MNILFQKQFQRVFGTFPLKGTDLENAIASAVQTGYRAFDTAQMYGNEVDTGNALDAIKLDRSELCLITKIHPDHYDPEIFWASLDQSLSDLRTPFVDVLFLHWPPREEMFETTLDLLAEAQQRGLAKSIGISNFNRNMMLRARKHIDGPIVANQVEFHPLLDQSILLETASETGIPLMSYSAIARGEVFKYPIFSEIAEIYGKTPAQIVLRWILQKGVIANSMSTKPNNISNNFDVMDFTLASIDMAKIDNLSKVNYRIVTKDRAPWAPDWD